MRYKTFYVLERNITCIYDYKNELILPMEYDIPNEAIEACKKLNESDKVLTEQKRLEEFEKYYNATYNHDFFNK